MVSIETYESKYKSQWDSFIDVSKNATFLFKRDFLVYKCNIKTLDRRFYNLKLIYLQALNFEF